MFLNDLVFFVNIISVVVFITEFHFLDPSNPPDNLKDFSVKDKDFHSILKALFEHVCKNELEDAVTLFRHTLKTFKYINNGDIQKLYEGEFNLIQLIRTRFFTNISIFYCQVLSLMF